MSGEAKIRELAGEVDAWRRKFKMADTNRRKRQREADKPKHPQPNRLSFSVSVEEARIVAQYIQEATAACQYPTGYGVALNFAARMKRSLARRELLGKEAT